MTDKQTPKHKTLYAAFNETSPSSAGGYWSKAICPFCDTKNILINKVERPQLSWYSGDPDSVREGGEHNAVYISKSCEHLAEILPTRYDDESDRQVTPVGVFIDISETPF